MPAIHCDMNCDIVTWIERLCIMCLLAITTTATATAAATTTTTTILLVLFNLIIF